MSQSERIRQLIAAAKRNQAELIAQRAMNTLSDEDKKELASDERRTAEYREDAAKSITQLEQTQVNIIANSEETTEWEWHENQIQAIDLASRGESFCLIGAAGTGKTTTVKEIVRRLMISGHIGVLQEDTKYLKKGTPSIVFCAYTRRAVNNLKKHLPEHLRNNCITFHKLLEFEPVEVANADGEVGMRFLPMRDKNFKLPHIDFIVMEEGSMTGIDLYNMVIAATSNAVNEIHIGDLNQLKPVFGDAILGYKLNMLPVVELTKIYRQALESPIISFAHKILEGKPLNEDGLTKLAEEPYLNFLPYKKNLEGGLALRAVKKKFERLIADGNYDFENSIVLCPFNVNFGCNELNKTMAQAHGEVRGAYVHEIIAGFETIYLAEGDRVLYKKDAGVILSIKANSKFSGKRYRLPSLTLNRWGVEAQPSTYVEHDFDEIMNLQMWEENQEEDKDGRTFMASHTIEIALDSGEVMKVSSASGYNNDVEFGYCMTVHKAQGSQWEHVYFVLHRDHNVMVNRELLYTGVTRAEKYLTVIYSPETRSNLKDGTFGGGIKRQAIRGKTLQDKINYFSQRMDKLNTNSAKAISFTVLGKKEKNTDKPHPEREVPTDFDGMPF